MMVCTRCKKAMTGSRTGLWLVWDDLHVKACDELICTGCGIRVTNELTPAFSPSPDTIAMKENEGMVIHMRDSNKFMVHDSIYDEFLELGVEMSNWQSDLYVPVNDLTSQVINKWVVCGRLARPTTFASHTEGKHMYELNFEYMPYWRSKRRI